MRIDFSTVFYRNIQIVYTYKNEKPVEKNVITVIFYSKGIDKSGEICYNTNNTRTEYTVHREEAFPMG